MRKSKIRLLEQIWAKNPYVTFFLGHPVYVFVSAFVSVCEVRLSVRRCKVPSPPPVRYEASQRTAPWGSHWPVLLETQDIFVASKCLSIMLKFETFLWKMKKGEIKRQPMQRATNKYFFPYHPAKLRATWLPTNCVNKQTNRRSGNPILIIGKPLGQPMHHNHLIHNTTLHNCSMSPAGDWSVRVNKCKDVIGRNLWHRPQWSTDVLFPSNLWTWLSTRTSQLLWVRLISSASFVPV